MHLRAADLVGDLRLSEVSDEPHGDHALFPLGQFGQQRAQRLDVVDVVVGGVAVAEGRGDDGVVGRRPYRGIDGQWPHGVVGQQRFADLLLAAVEALGQIRDGRHVPISRFLSSVRVAG